jgi:uncharacterized damage-inducible protein DinB
MEDLRYPIGKFRAPASLTEEERLEHLRNITLTPKRIRQAVAGLDEAQLSTPYRDGGWTVRQVVHHLADSHINAFVRFKLALTEDRPTIKAYQEKLWAETPDATAAPVEASLKLLESLHERWVIFLNSLSPEDFNRKFNHPENGVMDLNALLALYSWHGRHHEGHITNLRNRKGWG